MSQARANKLKDYFVAKGVEKNKLVAIGHGETQPLRTRDEQDKLDPDRHGESVNKRVTLKILK